MKKFNFDPFVKSGDNMFFRILSTAVFGSTILSIVLSFFAWKPEWFPLGNFEQYFHTSVPVLYRQFFLFGILVLIGLFVFRSRLRRILEGFINQEQLEKRRAAKILVISGTVLFVVYMLKLHVGFFHAGVPNWNYQNLRYQKIITEKSSFPDYLLAGIKPADNPPKAPYQTGAYVYLLHSNGVARPYNSEFLGMTWPDILYQKPEKMKQMVQNRLENFKNNRAFLIPRDLSYGQHLTFKNIDYSDYPEFEEIDSISTWWVVVNVDQQIVEPVFAKRIVGMDF